MGATCAICKTHQPFTRTLTVDQKPAVSAKDVLGYELKCGHKFGNKEFMKIQKIVNEIRIRHSEASRRLEQEMKNGIAEALEQANLTGGQS